MTRPFNPSDEAGELRRIAKNISKKERESLKALVHLIDTLDADSALAEKKAVPHE